MFRFALFGAGRAGTIHAENIAHHPHAQLAYVFDINREAAQRLVAKFGGQTATGPDRIWAAGEVDAVLIASSTNTHVELLRGAMKAGKAVYCEKPIDLEIAKVQAVVQDAAQTDVPILVGFRRRFLPAYQAIRQSIQNGDVGRLEAIHMISRDFKPPAVDYIHPASTKPLAA